MQLNVAMNGQYLEFIQVLHNNNKYIISTLLCLSFVAEYGLIIKIN